MAQRLMAPQGVSNLIWDCLIQDLVPPFSTNVHPGGAGGISSAWAPASPQETGIRFWDLSWAWLNLSSCGHSGSKAGGKPICLSKKKKQKNKEGRKKGRNKKNILKELRLLTSAAQILKLEQYRD